MVMYANEAETKENDKKLSTTYTLFEGTKSGRITKALLENNSQRKDFYTFSFYKMLKKESTMSLSKVQPKRFHLKGYTTGLELY